MKNPISRVVAGLLTATFAISPVFAHEAPCPYCAMPVTQDTPTQDNEVALKIGRKRIEYKCVYCALSEAKTEFKGDLTISAPSEKKGQPVLIKRRGEAWSVLPATAFFVASPKIKHKICQEQARAFSTQDAAKKYAAINGGDVLTLVQLDARAQ